MAINGTTATNTYSYYATIGVLCLLVAYAMVGLAAGWQLVHTRGSGYPRSFSATQIEAVIPSAWRS